MIDERLIRPIGYERDEIQHDRLAAAVIEARESDRYGKVLAAKATFFRWTMVPFAPSELVYLFRHRRKIRPTERELQFGLVLDIRRQEERGSLKLQILELLNF